MASVRIRFKTEVLFDGKTYEEQDLKNEAMRLSNQGLCESEIYEAIKDRIEVKLIKV